MAITKRPPTNVPLIPINLVYYPQVTADVADAAVKVPVPFPCRIYGVTGQARAIGGGTPFTDVDVQVMKNAQQLVAALPVVDGSALGRPTGTLALSGTDLDMAADDFLHLKLIDVTGGATSPTLDGLQVTVWVARK